MSTGKAHFLRDPETRRKRLGLKPDIDKVDRKVIATRVFFGEPLQDYEREFVARLVDQHAADLLIGVTATLAGAKPPKKRNKGRPPTTEAAINADETAEAYFFDRALWPNAKHKEETLPRVAAKLGVSERSIEKAVRRTDPTRRAEMESAADAFARGYAECMACAAEEWARRAKQSGSQKARAAAY